MVQLFLSRPPSGVSTGADAVKERIFLLQSLGSVIWSVITSGDRHEPRLWLCNTISSVLSIDHRGQRKLFVDLLESKPSKRNVAAQLLRNPRRILQWFDHFATTSEFGHKKGARAMSQFAFINRDICWEELEWKGRHGQSPAVVATKPHYFHDLDVLRTMENFLEHVPEFWSSDELAESVKDGDILHIDTQFFVDQFIYLMYEKDGEDVWDMIDEFLVEQQFSSLCQHLLVLLNERELRTFLDSLSKCLSERQNFEDIGHSSSWLEMLLSSNIDLISLDDFLLLNAIISHARQIVRLLGDDEHETEERKIEELLKTSTGYSDADHWSLMLECTKVELFLAIKCIGLQSWILHYVLSKECKTKKYCESLFVNNEISFKKCGDYSLICSSGHLEGGGSDDDNEACFAGGNRKRKRSRKKKKNRKYEHNEADMDELIDFDGSNRWQDSHLGNERWLISTDGFSCPWNMFKQVSAQPLTYSGWSSKITRRSGGAPFQAFLFILDEVGLLEAELMVCRDELDGDSRYFA
ncbi:hypothetical protein Taro_019505 [Colocasia esculenta]|uniref:Uncharacterized protein n=1 Tax=Colocasia esculenta TaxID=4460 RepID=A0A843UU26_COLES|nr:hypothetical protein [Colocasia esculenta]